MCWPAGTFPVLCVVLKHEETLLLPMGGENSDSYDTGWVVATISHAPPSSLPLSLLPYPPYPSKQRSRFHDVIITVSNSKTVETRIRIRAPPVISVMAPSF